MIWKDSPLVSILKIQSYQLDSSIYRMYINEVSSPKRHFVFIDYSFDVYFEEDILDIKNFENIHKETLVDRLNELENLRNYFSSIPSLTLERTKSQVKEVYTIKEFKKVSSLKYNTKHKPKICKKKDNCYILEWVYCGTIINHTFSSSDLLSIQKVLPNILVDSTTEIIEKLNIFLNTM